MLHVIGSRIHNRTVIANAQIGTCAECLADVWLSPAQCEQIATRRTRTLCSECSRGSWSLIAVTDRLAEEYDKALPNWRQLARERGMTVINLDNPEQVVDS